MTTMSHDMAGSVADVTFGYTWNTAGQLASRTVSNPAYVYAPTTGATSYVNNGRNQVTSVGGTAITYDSDQNTATALGNSYAYDAVGRLTTGTIGGSAYTFGYDPRGRLYSTGSTKFQYIGAQLIGEYDGSGTLTTRHIPGPGIDQPVASYFGSDRFQQIADERGSIIGVAEAGGTVAINRYDEYGVPDASNRFQYTGQAYMAPDLYYYRARAYAPELGRFLQPDPIGYAAGPNIYAYVGGDPVNRLDPFGMDWVVIPCNRTTTVGVTDRSVPGGVAWETREVRSYCTVYFPGQNDYFTGTPDHYIQTTSNYNENCLADIRHVELTFVQSPWGLTALPTPKEGTAIKIFSVSAEIAAGLGFSGEVGGYTYTASNGAVYSGYFSAAGLAVGAGAGASGGGRLIWGGLESLFGASWTVSGRLGFVQGSVSGDAAGRPNSVGVRGGVGGGATGSSTGTFPIGPASSDCFRPDV